MKASDPFTCLYSVILTAYPVSRTRSPPSCLPVPEAVNRNPRHLNFGKTCPSALPGSHAQKFLKFNFLEFRYGYPAYCFKLFMEEILCSKKDVAIVVILGY